MGANMMETLKQIQRDLADQKAYMRNLHVINKNLNEKLNFMEDKFTFMVEKISDLPQVLITIGRLEQQVQKNNMLLFGNDETEERFENRDLVPNKSDHDDKNTDHVVQPFEKCIDHSEETSIHNSSKVSLIEDAKENGKETKNDDSFQRADQYKDEVRGLITNEIKEIIRDFMKIKHTSVEETAICCRHDPARISPTYLNIDQIKKLDDKLNNITDVYQSDMREIKELIKESIAINQKSIQESSKPLLKQETSKVQPISFSADQISQLNAKLKRITDMTQSETREIKELIENSVAASKLSMQEVTKFHKQDTAHRETLLRQTSQSAIREMKELIKDLAKKIPIEGTATASTVRELKTVQISPTYFSAEQLSKLNSELQQIADTYQESNIFPIVQVTPGAADEHPVMKLLRKGVFYKSLIDNTNYPIKLGLDGLKRSDVIDLITDYPDFTVNNVVREWMVAKKKYEWFKNHEHWRPLIYEGGNFKYLPIQH